jgi:hypothetical protein
LDLRHGNLLDHLSVILWLIARSPATNNDNSP